MQNVTLAQYRKVGRLVHVRIAKSTGSQIDLSSYNGGNFPNMQVMGVGSVPNVACPESGYINGPARADGAPASLVLSTNGAISWTGGFPKIYPSGSALYADFTFFTDN